MTKKTIILTILVFIIALSARLYLITIKQGLHCDETFTIIISKNNDLSITKILENNKIHTAIELKEQKFKSKNDLKSVLKSIKQLRTDNPDKLHTNLYPSLVRLSQLNSPELDIQNTTNRALFLNLIIFILSFFVMIKLLNRININENFIPLALLIAYLNTGSLSSFLFLKPYILQELAYIFITYVFVGEINKFQNSDKEKSKITSAIMPIVAVSFALLSGYFSIIYIFLLTITYAIYSIYYKQYKNIFNMIYILVISLITTLVIYPDFFDFFITKNPTTQSYILDISDTIKNLLHIFISYLFYLPVVILLLYCFIKNILKKTLPKFSIVWLILILNLITAVLATFFGLYKVLRYSAPTFAILSIIIPYMISYVKNQKERVILIIITIAIYIIGFIFSTKFESPDSATLINSKNRIKPNIENTFINTNCAPIKNSKIPIVIFTKASWQMNNVLPYMKDNQKVIINLYNEPIKPLDHFIILIGDEDIISPEGYLLLNQFHCQRFEGYELKKDN